MPNANLHDVYMEVVQSISKCSYSERKRVGAILVSDGRIISTGYNGMPLGLDNNCEYSKDQKLITKPEVIHAEANAILFAARNGISTLDATLYCSLSPCIECSKMIIQSGIRKVYFKEYYRLTDGNNLLLQSKILLEQW